jgi:hypothetical protein
VFQTLLKFCFSELLKLPILGTIYECIESINITSELDNLLAELITDGSDVLSAVVQSNTMTKYPSAVRLMLQKAITLFPKYRTAVKGGKNKNTHNFIDLFIFPLQIVTFYINIINITLLL